MKRYDCYYTNDFNSEYPAHSRAAVDGDWVSFEDAQAEVADMAQTIKLLRDELTAAYLERDALKGRLRTARNIIVDTQNFIHPTQVWRDTELMQRVIDKFLEEVQS